MEQFMKYGGTYKALVPGRDGRGFPTTDFFGAKRLRHMHMVAAHDARNRIILGLRFWAEAVSCWGLAPPQSSLFNQSTRSTIGQPVRQFYACVYGLGLSLYWSVRYSSGHEENCIYGSPEIVSIGCIRCFSHFEAVCQHMGSDTVFLTT
jgi:hypothetical protein